MLIFIRAAT